MLVSWNSSKLNIKVIVYKDDNLQLNYSPLKATEDVGGYFSKLDFWLNL